MIQYREICLDSKYEENYIFNSKKKPTPNNSLKILSNIEIEEIKNIRIIGNKPLTNSDFLDEISNLVTKYDRIQIETDGLIFSDINTLNNFVKKKLINFRIKLFSHNSTTYDLISQTKNNFQKLKLGLENIKNLKNGNNKIFFSGKIIICDENISDLTEIVRFAIINTADQIVLDIRTKKTTLSKLTNEINKCIQYAESKKVWTFVEGIPHCILSENKYNIYENFCETSLKYQKTEICTKCKYNSVCKGLSEELVQYLNNLTPINESYFLEELKEFKCKK